MSPADQTTPYDLHLVLGCASPPAIDDLARQAPALADPALRTRLLQHAPGPGFLGLDVPHALADQLLGRLRPAGAHGEAVPAVYRRPRVTRQQALAIAAPALEAQAAGAFPGYAFDAPGCWTEGVRWWVCGRLSPALVRQGYVPGGVTAYVDKHDGHIWSPEEIRRLAAPAG